MIILLNLFILIAFAAITTVTVQNPQWTSWAFVNCSYYILFALVIAWAFSLFSLWREKRNEATFIKTHRNGIIFTLLLSSLIFISVPHYFRILSDETNTLSVAKSLTFTKQAQNVTEGKWYYGMFWMSKFSIDKRPMLFPFLVSVINTTIGYRPENAFVLNFIALWGSLFLLYLLIRAYLSEILAFASILLVMSQPFMSLTASSTSIEILNLFFILSSFVSLKYFLNDPTRRNFTLLCLNLLMLANARYESFIFLGVIMLCLLAFRYIRLDFFKQSAVYAFMLFLTLPLIWQRVIYLRIPDADMPNGLWIKAFAFKNISVNISLLFKYITDLNGHLGYAGVVDILGLIAIVYGAINILRGHFQITKKDAIFLSCGTLSLFAFFAVIIFYDQARMTQHPMNGRLYMPLLVALSILPIYALADLIKNNTSHTRLVMVAALSLFVFYHPVAQEGRVENQLYIVRNYRYALDFLRHQKDKNFLVICNRPGQYVIYNYGAISFSTANQDKSSVLEQFKNRLFNKIFVIQEVPYAAKPLKNPDYLDPDYILNPMEELQGSSAFKLRISEVSNILKARPAGFEPAPAAPEAAALSIRLRAQQ